MSVTIESSSLNAMLKGRVVTRDMDGQSKSILQHRGLKFGTIPTRFAKALPKDDWGGQAVDCTEYGPRCPQNAVDIDHFLRVPHGESSKIDGEDETENEFECLNLVITQPYPHRVANAKPGLPVLIWIHGGSQVITFGSAVSKCGDPFRLVADSAELRSPIIMVSLNYRLNIFAFGDGKEINLGLSDQQLGIEWVKTHIADFGGDVNNITLFGQSAGAVYAHANMFTVSGIKRDILSSGSLYLSPPLPRERGYTYIHSVTKKVQTYCGMSLKDAPVEFLLKALRELNVKTQWIQEEESLKNWRNRAELVEELMIGDVEYESVLWRNGIEGMSPSAITATFDSNLNLEVSTELKQLYGIFPDRSTACRLGALDYINDMRYTMPIEQIVSKWKLSNKPIYRYLFDQVNPWQPSSRAHHAVDLVYLFGGYNESLRRFYGNRLTLLSLNSLYVKLGEEMRSTWIKFVNGRNPWEGANKGFSFSFGPNSRLGSINNSEFAARRRAMHIEVLREFEDHEALDRVVRVLAAGRLSFLN